MLPSGVASEKLLNEARGEGEGIPSTGDSRIGKNSVPSDAIGFFDSLPVVIDFSPRNWNSSRFGRLKPFFFNSRELYEAKFGGYLRLKRMPRRKATVFFI